MKRYYITRTIQEEYESCGNNKAEAIDNLKNNGGNAFSVTVLREKVKLVEKIDKK